ncbi:hypothetical protein AB0K60_29355 [Thermopolyspora sp. NPDC052614]|uniref:hypothetical protein n=1 Tax=Thermopolyspora sp. NPDC052614 TaxID=3155682 RepID=UPI003416A38E
MTWLDHVRADPLPWLLEWNTPAVRAATLQRLLDLPPDSPEVREARDAAMDTDPIKSILAAQNPAGWWESPGSGYGSAFTGTVWQLIILDQLGADGRHPQIAAACDYVLTWTQASTGGFGASTAKTEEPPPPETVMHCLNGNLLRALIGFGHLDDERVQASVDWAARTITGEGVDRWYPSGSSGPGFACGGNDGHPCAWGAIKELAAFARIPPPRRAPQLQRAIDEGVRFLFSRDPVVADYPMGGGDTVPSRLWFKPGFPVLYAADVLQTLEVLAELGHATDERLAPALRWLKAHQNQWGRWLNRAASNRKLVMDIERQGLPSKWVTLRACTVLRAAYG